jgi:hypothetical protein
MARQKAKHRALPPTGPTLPMARSARSLCCEEKYGITRTKRRCKRCPKRWQQR